MKCNLIIIFMLMILMLVKVNAGGVHIGGGNAPTQEKISPHEIQRFLENLHRSRYELLSALQIAGLQATRVLKTEPQLTTPFDAKEKTKLLMQSQIYQHLFTTPFLRSYSNTIQLTFEAQQPCFDPLGQSNDASVIYPNLNIICFSLSRLEEKLRKSTFEVELFALYLHELSHSLGSDEVEGNALQNEFRELGLKYKEFLPFVEDSHFDLKMSLSAVISKINEINFNQMDEKILCSNIIQIEQGLFKLFENYGAKSMGQAVLGLEGTIAFHGAFVVGSYLNDYCDKDKSIRQLYKFKQAQRMSVQQLYPDPTMILLPLGHDTSIKLSSFLLADLGDGIVTLTIPGDKYGLQENLNELRRLLDKAVPAL